VYVNTPEEHQQTHTKNNTTEREKANGLHVLRGKTSHLNAFVAAKVDGALSHTPLLKVEQFRGEREATLRRSLDAHREDSAWDAAKQLEGSRRRGGDVKRVLVRRKANLHNGPDSAHPPYAVDLSHS
jgi:hypothetical protein